MPFAYQTGEEIAEGDLVVYDGNPAQIELVADPTSSPEDWYVKQFGGAIMILEPKVFGGVRARNRYWQLGSGLRVEATGFKAKIKVAQCFPGSPSARFRRDANGWRRPIPAGGLHQRGRTEVLHYDCRDSASAAFAVGSAPMMPIGAVVFHLPRVKSGKSIGRLRRATDCSVSAQTTLQEAAS